MRIPDLMSRPASLLLAGLAVAAVEALRAGEPLGPRGTNMLGRALLELGDREAARHAFERTVSSDPGNAIARRQLDNLGPA